jgi:hypothetical protein
MSKLRNTFLIGLSIVLHNNTSAQTDTIKKFQTGSYIVKQKTIFELRNERDSVVALWENMSETVTVDRIKFSILKGKNGPGRLKQGLIDMRNGELIFPVQYDFFSTLGYDMPVLGAKKGNLLGLYSTRSKTYIPNKFKYASRPPTGRFILLGDSADTYVVDENLTFIDTIKGMISVRKKINSKAKSYLIVETKDY